MATVQDCQTPLYFIDTIERNLAWLLAIAALLQTQSEKTGQMAQLTSADVGAIGWLLRELLDEISQSLDELTSLQKGEENENI